MMTAQEPAGPPPAPDAGKALARRYFLELFGRGEVNLAPVLLAPDLLANDRPSSPDEISRFVLALRAAFPDWEDQIEDQIAEGNRVVSRVTSIGTHEGAWLGIPPSGRRVTRSGIFMFRIEDGKIAEVWDTVDQLGFLQQLGAELTLPT